MLHTECLKPTDPPFLEGAEGELWHFIMKAFLTADHAVGDAFFALDIDGITRWRGLIK
ncbi:hypothetical protein [Paenibacillus brasilensis]|uniref:Uncharacterized protein n=1 Tax=Paenibacillus brasilensis TaxID=128574 RepID=A0ABU0KWY7_9BACL|nr:hypothetical protein [Paenibacillus brasilensis]MDQ0492462.1 hypothetical protein [Paenibacillus brasilensis]